MKAIDEALVKAEEQVTKYTENAKETKVTQLEFYVIFRIVMLVTSNTLNHQKQQLVIGILKIFSLCETWLTFHCYSSFEHQTLFSKDKPCGTKLSDQTDFL